MVQITFVEHDGNNHVVEAAAGMTLMEAARDDDVRGILAECGGACSCSPCHVYVADAWAARVGPPGEDEAEMLGALADVIEVKPTSRLSCQIHITEDLDGLRVHIPKEQPGI